MGSNERPVIDGAVHPAFRHDDEIRDYLVEPWRSRPFPIANRYWYPAPNGESVRTAKPQEGRAGSDPVLLRQDVFGSGDVAAAVLLPLTRGLTPDTDVATNICRATNKWLADTWLGPWNADKRFFGSIRINPDDPDAAVREIEEWAGHPLMVQVAIPLEAHRPYGQRCYSQIWSAAVKHNLPVAVHSDGGAGTDFLPTATGYPRRFIEYNSLFPANFFYHLSSLIAEGTFERLPGLRFLFADGGLDFMPALMWRMDQDWPISRIEVPWVLKRPTEYLRAQVRFSTARLEEPPDDKLVDWFELSNGGDLLIFGSNYPHWSHMTSIDCYPNLAPALRERILFHNASAWYGIPPTLVHSEPESLSSHG